MVISPTGSIIYHKKALEWIAKESTVIFLNTPLEIIEARLAETPKAVAGLAERGLKNIWDERMPIYMSTCNFTIDTKDKKVEEIVDEILTIIK